MVDGVNNKDGIGNSQIEQQLSVSKVVTNPFKNPYQNQDNNLLIDEAALSTTAMNLYQREKDIAQFNDLALSDPEDLSHDQLVSDLKDKGIVDPFSDEALQALLENEKLLKDLEL